MCFKIIEEYLSSLIESWEIPKNNNLKANICLRFVSLRVYFFSQTFFPAIFHESLSTRSWNFWVYLKLCQFQVSCFFFIHALCSHEQVVNKFYLDFSFSLLLKMKNWLCTQKFFKLSLIFVQFLHLWQTVGDHRCSDHLPRFPQQMQLLSCTAPRKNVIKLSKWLSFHEFSIETKKENLSQSYPVFIPFSPQKIHCSISADMEKVIFIWISFNSNVLLLP